MNTIMEKELHTLAHEIKNPLSICNGYLEMFMNKETKTKYLEIIKEEIDRTLNIINNYSKKTKYEEIDLSYLLNDVYDLLKLILKNKDTEIILLGEEETYIEGNYNELKQVLVNILKNSLEAKTKEKLLIVISLKEHNDSYELSITDNGVGMTIEELSHIGDDYYTTKLEGTGLGIPYCKKIIKNHNGTINYYSRKNIGTKVLISLPKKSPKTFNNSNNY